MTVTVPPFVYAGEYRGEKGAAGAPGPTGPVGPTGTPGVGGWAPSTAYTAGDVAQAQDGSRIVRNATGTSRATFDTTEQAAWTTVLAKVGTLEQVALAASITSGAATAIGTPKVKAVDLWNSSLFDGGLNLFVTGQNVSTLATTSAVSAGATVLPLNSVTNVTAGVSLITNYGTATQQVHRVVSVAGLNVTVARPVVTALGVQAVASFWNNSAHVTTGAGMLAVGYATMNAKDAGGAYLITGTAPKVTVLGNSWVALIGTNFATYLPARIPAATVVNAGIGGNSTADMLARFDTDVPSDSNYVLLFEWINDTYPTKGVPPAVQAKQWEQLVEKVQAIGATPIVVGPVPLADYPTASASQQAAFRAQFYESTATYPAMNARAAYEAFGNAGYIVKPNSTSIGIGIGSLAATPSGGGNVALGGNSGNKVTTGTNNLFGGYNSGLSMLTGVGHVFLGAQAGALATAATGNVGVGMQAGYAAATSGNAHVGYQAGYAPGGNTSNATTTGQMTTFVGYQSGGVAAASYVTAIGASTIAGASHATALGAGVSVGHSGGVAIGRDNAGTSATTAAINDFVLGTALHQVQVPGRLNTAASTTTQAGFVVPHGTAPTSPTNGAVWTTTAGMFVRINGTTKTVTLT